jgi:hypothetical protein
MTNEATSEAVACLGCSGLMPARRGMPVCSSACYQRIWRRRRRALRIEFCVVCERPFTPTRGDAKFCSGACRFKAYRARKKASERALARAREAPWQASASPGLVDTRSKPEVAPGAVVGPARPDPARRRADFIASLIG